MDVAGTFHVKGKKIEIECDSATSFDASADFDSGKVCFEMLPYDNDHQMRVFPVAMIFKNSKGKRLVLIIDHELGKRMIEKLSVFLQAQDAIEKVGTRMFGADVI